MHLSRVLMALGAIACTSIRALGQQPAPATQQSMTGPPTLMTADVRADVVDTVAAELTRFYAVADTGQLIADHLRERLRAGAYDKLTDPRLFAEAVSADMKAINHDRHLALLLRGPGQVMPMGMARLPRGGPGGAGGGATPPAVLEVARHTNFSLGRIDIFPGNIGYFQIHGFPGVPGAQEAITNALKYLENTDAIIFDIREHSGGSGTLSNFLISHFVGADTVHVLDVDIRAAGQKNARYTLATVPGPRRPTVPVYILVGRGTVSAGEDFAFVMKNLGRATLVGEPTAGAGRNNPTFDAGHGFAASISASRVSDPKTGAEWEGIGVIPNVRTSMRGALAEAQQLALNALAEKAPDAVHRSEYELTKEYVTAQNSPRTVPVNVLTQYEGLYGEQRVITVEDGKLTYRFDPTRVGTELVALNDSTFATTLNRFRFERDPKATYKLTITALTGAPLVFERTGPPPKIPSER